MPILKQLSSLDNQSFALSGAGAVAVMGQGPTYCWKQAPSKPRVPTQQASNALYV